AARSARGRAARASPAPRTAIVSRDSPASAHSPRRASRRAAHGRIADDPLATSDVARRGRSDRRAVELPPVDRITLRWNGLESTAYAAGTGPVVLCLHGFPDDAGSFRHQLAALADAGYRAVAPTM